MLEVKIKDPNTVNLLSRYLDKLRTYPRFDAGQLVRIYADSWGDFCAVESLSYNWCFTSNRHKVADMIQSSTPPVEVTFGELIRWVNDASLPF